MRLVKLETQGESHLALVNPDQIAYLTQGIYGTTVHFASGEHIVCQGELEDIVGQLFAEPGRDTYLIAEPRPAAL